MNKNDIEVINNASQIWVEYSSDVNKRNKIFTLDEPIPPNARYKSLFIYTPEFSEYGKKHEGIRGYKGEHSVETLVLDFDSDNISQAQADVISFIEMIQHEYDITDEQIRVYFSGNKGFHIELPITLFGHNEFEFAGDINVRCRKTVESLTGGSFKTLDLNIYDITRIFRLPNTQHEKSKLYKIPLSVHEVRTLSVDDLRKLAKSKRSVDEVFDDDTFYGSKPIPQLVELWNSSYINGNRRNGRRRDNGRGDADAHDVADDKGAKIIISKNAQKYLKAYGVVNEGERNSTLTSLIGRLRSLGIHRGEILDIAHAVNKANFRPPLDEDEVIRVCDSVMSYADADVDDVDAVDAVDDDDVDDMSTRLNEIESKYFIPQPDNKPPSRLDSVTFNDISFAKKGHLSLIKGILKSGKSNVCSGLVSATIDTNDAVNDIQTDTLGFKVNHNIIKKTIYLDCEQDVEDVWNAYDTVFRRLGINHKDAIRHGIDLPDIKYVGTRGSSIKDRLEYLELICALTDIDMIIIDTVRGLMYDYNSVKESMELLEKLEMLTVKYDVCIVATIHKNLGDVGKSAGHIGSLIEQQAYAVLDVETDGSITVGDDTVSIRHIYVQYARRGESGDHTATYFMWDDDSRLFVSCDKPQGMKEKNKRGKSNERLKQAQAVLAKPMKYMEFVNALVSAGYYTNISTAKGVIKKMVDESVVKRDGDLYRLYTERDIEDAIDAVDSNHSDLV